MYSDKRKAAYVAHARHAKARRIEFELTFEEWWGIWDNSGCWNERGIRKGQYVMARFQDRGAYAIGNVEIITGEENRRQPQVRAKISVASTGRIPTLATRRKLSKARAGNSNAKGKHWTLSTETRRRQSLGQLGNTKNIGRIWITDGVKDAFVYPPKKLPKGWKRGRCKIAGNNFAKK